MNDYFGLTVANLVAVLSPPLFAFDGLFLPEAKVSSARFGLGFRTGLLSLRDM